jgi:hypothetical protein
MKEKIKGAILIISCHKHKNSRLKKYNLPKTTYGGYKVFYILGNPHLSLQYEIREGNMIKIKCEDSYVHILKKVGLSISLLMDLYEIDEGILRCVDDLVFDEKNLETFLESPKTEDYMGNMDGYGNSIVKFENIVLRVDNFMTNYFNKHPEDFSNPLNGIENDTEILKIINKVPNCRYVNGVVTWLSKKSCNLLLTEITNTTWNTYNYYPKYGFPYVIEDVGIGFILAKHDIYPVNRKFYINLDSMNRIESVETIAVHTNEFKDI